MPPSMIDMKKSTQRLLAAATICFALAQASAAYTYIETRTCINGECTICINGKCTITGQTTTTSASVPRTTSTTRPGTGCGNGQCTYKDKAYCVGDTLMYGGLQYKCKSNGKFQKSCLPYNGRYYYDGEEATDARNAKWVCSGGTWKRIGTSVDTSRCGGKYCIYMDAAYCVDETLIYSGRQYLCKSNGKFQKSCLPYNGRYYYDGEEIQDGRDVNWRCDDGDWVSLGCDRGYCYYKAERRCYYSGRTIVYQGSNWLCRGDGTWMDLGHGCYNAKEQRRYADGERWTSPYSGNTQECRDGEWFYV